MDIFVFTIVSDSVGVFVWKRESRKESRIKDRMTVEETV